MIIRQQSYRSCFSVPSAVLKAADQAEAFLVVPGQFLGFALWVLRVVDVYLLELGIALSMFPVVSLLLRASTECHILCSFPFLGGNVLN